MNDRRTLSVRGLLMGATIGLGSGLLLDYLALVGLRLLDLPHPGLDFYQLLESGWFVPVMLATTALGAMYYSAAE